MTNTPTALRRRRLRIARKYGDPRSGSNPASASEVASQIGISPVTLFRWETARIVPRAPSFSTWVFVIEKLEQRYGG